MDHLARIRAARDDRDTAVEAANSAFHEVIADALRARVPVTDVAEAAGFHRNHIARIRAAAGIPDARRRPKLAPGEAVPRGPEDGKA